MNLFGLKYTHTSKLFKRITGYLKYPAIFILFSFIFINASYNIYSLDYLFHVKCGEYICEHKTIPKEDIFSFTTEGREWVNHEWLYQVLIYSIYNRYGTEGLFYFKTAIFFIIFLLYWIIAFRINWIPAFIFLSLALHISLPRFILRPDNLSLIFFIVFLLPFVLKKRWLLFSLPFIQILWSNTHGFFILGPAILLFYIVASRIHTGSKDPYFYRYAKVIFIAVILACLVNPYFIKIFSYPLNVIKNSITGSYKAFFAYIGELHRPHISEYSLFYLYALATGIFIFLRKNINIFYLLLWLLFFGLALSGARNVYFFIPIGLIIFVDSYDSIKRFCRKKLFQPAGYAAFKTVFFILAVFIAGGMTKAVKDSYAEGFFRLTEDNKLEIFSKFMKLEPSAYPQKMAKFIEKAELPARMFNNFSLGSFLIYNFFPERKVFIDGRTELYGETFFKEYLLAYNGNESFFDKIFKEYNLQGLIFGYTREEEPTGIIRIAYEKGFRCVYFARDGIIFVSDDFLSKNKRLHPFTIDFKDYSLPSIGKATDLKLASFSSKGLYKQAAVFYLLGFYDKARHILNEIIKVYPNNYKAYYLLAKIFYNEKDYEEAFINCRKSLLFNFKFIKAKRLLAKIYIETGSPEEALELIKNSGITTQDLKEIRHGL